MMRIITSLVILGFLVLGMCHQTASAQILHKSFDQIFSQSDFSGAVIITQNGRIIWENAYGMANIEHGVKNTIETKFRIGSITKQFTAMAILILQEKDLLNVEDTVEKHLNDVPQAWKEVTIHQLLTHTSGIMHSWALEDFVSNMAVPRTLDETLVRFYGEPLLFEVGSQFLYSGVGYFLLAKLIKSVSGMEYEAFLQQEIFAPLRMTSTGSDTTEQIIRGRAAGYLLQADGSVENAAPIHMPILTGGGNLYSTVQDLARWGNALSRKMLLSADSYRALYQTELENYAYGWHVETLDGRKVIYHGGRAPGFLARVVQLPDQNIFVAILSNQAGPATQDSMERAMEIVLESPNQ